MDFGGKIVLVTGAGSGIGAAICRQFIECGSEVVALDINESGLNHLALSCGDKLLPVVCDLTSESDIEASVAAIRKRLDRVDVLINNAGIARFTNLGFTLEDFDEHFYTNLRAPMLMMKHCTGLLQKSTSPCVINMASVAARIEWGNHFLYSCAKAGLEKFTKHLVRDLPWLRANCILPGVVDTAILNRLATPEQKSGLFELMEDSVPCGRVGTTDDIANAVRFLASDEAGYVSGASLVVDGGLSHSNRWLGL